MPAPRCYTASQVCEFLQLPKRSFYLLKKAGQLPYLQEIRPRTGRTVRYRADLVDQYLAGNWYGGERRKKAEKKTA